MSSSGRPADGTSALLLDYYRRALSAFGAGLFVSGAAASGLTARTS
jgi:hypothetical protein